MARRFVVIIFQSDRMMAALDTQPQLWKGNANLCLPAVPNNNASYMVPQRERSKGHELQCILRSIVKIIQNLHI